MNDTAKHQNTTVKYLVVGDSGVGKTCLLMRYCQDDFHTEYLSTIGVDFKIKRVQYNGKPITLNIWDTAGQERFRNITKSFYKGAHGIIVVYSITDPISFTHVESWIDQIRQNENSQTSMILVAAKTDLQKDRKVTTKQGKSLAEKYNMKFVETSAKDDCNVDIVFDELTQLVMGKIGDELPTKPKNMALEKETKQKKEKSKDCCN